MTSLSFTAEELTPGDKRENHSLYFSFPPEPFWLPERQTLKDNDMGIQSFSGIKYKQALYFQFQKDNNKIYGLIKKSTKVSL